jgi:AraC-like DNA-binding protein
MLGCQLIIEGWWRMIAAVAAKQANREWAMVEVEESVFRGVVLHPAFQGHVYLRGRIAGIARKGPRAKETLAHMQARRGTRGGLTVIELAAESGWSPSTLRRMFAHEPGVSRIRHPETLHRRGYVSIRIPRDVADRVLARHARKP